MRRRRWTWRAALALIGATIVAGCGADIEEPDLFLLTRTGQGTKLTLDVNDSGTIRCNGGKAKQISSALLIQARDLQVDLTKDATKKLVYPPVADQVFYYRVRMQQGTVSFPDRRAAGLKPLREAEVFAVDAAQQVCGLSG